MPPPIVTTCNQCSGGAPTYWQVTLSGVSNGSCSDCGDLNNTFTLNYVSGCIWRSNSLTLCGVSVTITLSYNSGTGNWELDIGGIATYVLSASSWKCVANNVMSLSGTPSDCLNLPSTVTVVAW